MLTKRELWVIWLVLLELRSPSSEQARLRIKVRALYFQAVD